MKYLVPIFILLTALPGYAQEITPELEAFQNLIGGRWIANGNWGSGTSYKQESEFETGLSGKLIKVKTWGNISETDYSFGLRSEGVRYWDESESVLKFWHYDVFGSAATGDVSTNGKDIFLSYLYDFGSGPMKLTDAWIFKSKNEYEFIVGIFEEGEWKQKYLSASFKRKPD